MFKRYGKIILIIIIIIQLITPLSFLFYQINIKKHLENDSEYIKLNINEIWINDNNIYIDFSFNELYNINEYYNFSYVIFEPSKNNEYSKISVSNTIPKNKKYIHNDSIDELSTIILEDYEQSYNINYENLYSKYTELENVASGNFTGPLTEAYALLKIYKNQYEIVEIYIKDYTLHEYIELYKNNEINLSRFVYHDYSEYHLLTEEDYLKVIDEEKINLYNSIPKY